MSNLRKLKKRELVNLIKGYEEQIYELKEDINNMSINVPREVIKEVIKTEYVIIDEDKKSDKKIEYLTRKIKWLRGLEKIKYENELQRLLKV